jgi:hypothetical protein
LHEKGSTYNHLVCNAQRSALGRVKTLSIVDSALSIVEVSEKMKTTSTVDKRQCRIDNSFSRAG